MKLGPWWTLLALFLSLPVRLGLWIARKVGAW
jgi:hypothetical protein